MATESRISKNGPRRISKAEIDRRTRAIEKFLRLGYLPQGRASNKPGTSAVRAAAQFLGHTSPSKLATQVKNGLIRPNWKVYKPRPEPEPVVVVTPAAHQTDLRKDIPPLLRKGAMTVKQLAERFETPPADIEAALKSLRDYGIAIHNVGTTWYIAPPQPGSIGGPFIEIVSRDDNTFCFGCTSDQHISSKYFRQDVLEDLYDHFVKYKAQCVFNAGNWVDGEASFNRHDLVVHGMHGQMKLLSKLYPKRKGLTTYAVAGDDHEGWWGQREGVDIGKYAEHVMREAGREDWVNMGFMEAHVRLVNKNTGAAAILAVVHPGGGSSYALSYRAQKILESLEGGEKPAVVIFGHYHKLWVGNIRNVWTILSGCSEDQTPFMRKRSIEAHVGGVTLELEQDPQTGAIIECTPRIRRYFNRGYYNNRWSHADEVNLPLRTIG